LCASWLPRFGHSGNVRISSFTAIAEDAFITCALASMVFCAVLTAIPHPPEDMTAAGWALLLGTGAFLAVYGGFALLRSGREVAAGHPLWESEREPTTIAP